MDPNDCAANRLITAGFCKARRDIDGGVDRCKSNLLGVSVTAAEGRESRLMQTNDAA
jgi:hypothetical protein